MVVEFTVVYQENANRVQVNTTYLICVRKQAHKCVLYEFYIVPNYFLELIFNELRQI
jgi:hypothetical protein